MRERSLHCSVCRADSGAASKCSSCKAKYDRRRRKELLDIIRKLKSLPCMDCGIQYPFYVMQFDHRPGTIKKDEVAKMAHRCRSLSVILEEIEKCDLVCANCHFERTWQRSNGTKNEV